MNILSIIRHKLSNFIKYISIKLFKLHNYINKINTLSRKEKSIIEKNIILKDKHKNEKAFIIVNGPSLKNQDLYALKNELTFVVSGFWKHTIINEEWQPTYYSILDKNFFKESDATHTFFKNMNERITRSIFFLPLFRGYSFNNKYKYIPNDKVYYVATHGNEFSSLDFTSLVEGWAGVSAFAISQAVYMGCNPIYLLGFDHDYLANRGVDHHFYEGGTIKGDTQTNIPLGDRIPYDVEMKANMKLWMNYRNLKRIANKKGIKILNATEKGYLDVFDRVNYNDIIQK